MRKCLADSDRMSNSEMKRVRKVSAKAKKERSRKGCQTCKKRKVKCDESHPSCKHCTRLNLQCSYDVVYRWDEEALQNGTTFGRSNQYKKSSLQHKYADYIIGKELAEARTFDYFLKSETSSLIKKLSKQDIPWVNTKNHVHFVNASHKDFSKYSCKTISKKVNRRVESSPLMHILATMLMDDFFLNSLETETSSLANTWEIGTSKEDWSDLADLANILPKEMLATDVFFDELVFSSATALPPLNIKYSLPNLTLHSNSYYNKLITYSPDEQNLVSYFIDTICPTCVCYSQIKKSAVNINPIYLTDRSFSAKQLEKNPFLFLIMPLAFKYDIVMDAVMATSAYQLFLSGNQSFDNVSRYYSEKAIKKLPDLIREKQCLHSPDWDEILATILLLCFNEISSTYDSVSMWMMYLNYAKYFVSQINALNASSPLANFFARYFITHEVIGQTALLDIDEDVPKSVTSNDVTLYLSSSLSDKTGREEFMRFIQKQGINGDLYLNTLRDKDTIINIVFGCCPYLICLTHQISCFAECCEGLAVESVETKQEFEVYISSRREQLSFEIQHISQEVQISEDDTKDTELIIKRIAEVRRLSTLIYLFIRIDLEGLYQNDGIVTKQFLNRKKEMEKSKTKIYELLDSLPEISTALLWPIFLLGVVAANYENERWLILDKLSKIRKTRKSISLKAAEDVIIAVWKEVDLGVSLFRWKDLIIDKGNSLTLALIN